MVEGGRSRPSSISLRGEASALQLPAYDPTFCVDRYVIKASTLLLLLTGRME